MDPQLADLIRRADRDEPRAADELFALLYDELRRLADRHLRKGGAGLTLSTTTLVHETYLKMAGRPATAYPDGARFFAYVSRAMRGLVIDYARRRGALKRDRGFEITFTDDAPVDRPGRTRPRARGPREGAKRAVDRRSVAPRHNVGSTMPGLHPRVQFRASPMRSPTWTSTGPAVCSREPADPRG